jgi:putative acyl-CoA dehydrogenase
VCKAAPRFVYEALECMGGNGYVEEGTMARLYREVPLNAIWEGSGNVMCLDVLRALGRDGEATQHVVADLAQATADLPGARDAASSVAKTLRSAEAEASARGAVERLAQLAAAAALNEWAPAIGETFARVRLAEPGGSTYGTARLTADEIARLLDRALPAA